MGYSKVIYENSRGDFTRPCASKKLLKVIGGRKNEM